MAEQPLNNSTEENKPAAQSNAGQSKTEVGDIHIGGDVGGSIIVGHDNVINITPEGHAFRSLNQLSQLPSNWLLS